MLNTQLKQWQAAILWLLTVPALFTIVWTQFPSGELDLLFILANFAMLLAAARISFRLSGISISVERWIVFVLFFQYGLWAEMLFMQLALVVVQLTEKSALPPLYRFATNSIMFAVVSVVSAFAFYLAGGVPGEMAVVPFTAAAVLYGLTYSVVNTFILYVMLRLEKESTAGLRKLALWDAATSLFFVPLAVTYSLLTDVLGFRSVLLLGAPILLTLYIIRRYAFTEELNKKLSSAVEVGHELSESLSTSEIIEKFVIKMQQVIRYDQLYLLDIKRKEELQLLIASEAGELTKRPAYFTFDPSALDRMDPDHIVISTTGKETRQLSHLCFSEAVQSVLIAPIIRSGEVEGYLLMTSFRRHFFEDLDKRMVELLAGYFETSIVKAFHYERTIAKSERCGLTKLHNFRYLSKQLAVEMDRFREGRMRGLSAIIMDIDHFKSINDTYGHQSGNDILVAFAGILKKYETDSRTLARFGGEEFVLLLPGMMKSQAAHLAERIRKEVEQTLFRIEPDLSDRREPIGIHLTVSLGVSSIPEDTENELSLLRNADRALYIGGKQAGRNRVGVYESDKTKPIGI